MAIWSTVKSLANAQNWQCIQLPLSFGKGRIAFHAIKEYSLPFEFSYHLSSC